MWIKRTVESRFPSSTELQTKGYLDNDFFNVMRIDFFFFFDDIIDIRDEPAGPRLTRPGPAITLYVGFSPS